VVLTQMPLFSPMIPRRFLSCRQESFDFPRIKMEFAPESLPLLMIPPSFASPLLTLNVLRSLLAPWYAQSWILIELFDLLLSLLYFRIELMIETGLIEILGVNGSQLAASE